MVRQFGAWDPETQKRSFQRCWRPDLCQIIVYRGRDIGVLAEERKRGYIFLSEIQIDPSAQNRGIGTEILTNLCERARSLGLPVRLQVLRFSRAIKLYKRLGFKQYGKTRTHFLLKKTPERAD
ncbi:MAG: GNAT family N-acetyltransferase [Limisphaerales bacterium]